MMLKMYLEFDGSPLTGEAEEKNMRDRNCNYAVREYVQQLEANINTLEGVLRQVKDDANKLMDRLGKLEKDNAVDESPDNCNKQVHDENKLSGEYNDTEEIDSVNKEDRTRRKENLEFFDARPNLRQIINDQANKLMDHLEKLEKDNNNRAQDNCNKQVHDENKLSEEYNDTEEIDSANKEDPTRRKEKLEFFDAGPNCVHIQNFKCSDPSFFKAFLNVHQLARIPDNSIASIRIIVKSDDYLDYQVYFCDEDVKKEFLKFVR